MKKILLSIIGILSIVAFVAIAQPDKVLQIFRGGEMIHEFAVSDLDYIEVNDRVAAPSQINAEHTGSAIIVSWSEVVDATYNLYRSADNVEYTLIATELKENKFVDQNPLTGDNYYKVRAIVESVTSDYSPVAQALAADNTINGHEYVDLGLPSGLKWATCNIGATTPEEYGDYFAWGETTPKLEYTMENCKTFGQVLPDFSGNPEYDAATANWGGTWRMPTHDEMQELYKECIWEWSTQNGVNGYLVTGPNGKQIFLPAAGYCYDTLLDGAGSYGEFRSSTSHDSRSAYVLFFSYSNVSGEYTYNDLSTGQSVRAVSGKIPANLKWATKDDPQVTKFSINLGADQSLLPALSKNTDAEVTVTSSNPEVAAYENGQIVVKAPGQTVLTAFCPETETYTAGEISLTLNVLNSDLISDGEINGHEYVDLGLPSGLKWATCNVGATTPSDYGDYFAWGETTPKSTYTPENSTTWKKDFTDISGNREFDAAAANWEGDWRIPTENEFRELVDNCSYAWVTNDGVLGCLFTGPNGNQIFLPGAGILGDTPMNVGFWSSYWGSTPGNDNDSAANFGGGSYDYSVEPTAWRFYGRSIRPVYGNGLREVFDDSNVLYTPGSSNGWDPSKSQMLPYNAFEGVYMGYALLGDEFKFINKPDWSGLNYGTDKAGSLDPAYDGLNIKVSQPGLYWCVVNTNTLTYSITPVQSLGAIGDMNGWKSQIPFTPSEDLLTWSGEVTFGEHDLWKIRSNENWDIQLSGDMNKLVYGGHDGGIQSPGEGTYKVTVDLSSIPYKYTAEKIETAEKINGHEYVDLGLPSGLKWATCNVGATTPTDIGDRFAWGETTPKSEYTQNNSKTYEKNIPDISGNPEYDAATANWGGTWRMPTHKEVVELRENCTWEWTTQNGVNVLLFTGPNGNQILLPAEEDCSDTLVDDIVYRVSYWGSSPYNSEYAYFLSYISNFGGGVGWCTRYYGCSVRAVSE